MQRPGTYLCTYTECKIRSKVSDATTDDGSGSWFKVFESGLIDSASSTWVSKSIFSFDVFIQHANV